MIAWYDFFSPCKLWVPWFFTCWVILDYILDILKIRRFCVFFKYHEEYGCVRFSSHWARWVQGMCFTQPSVACCFTVSFVFKTVLFVPDSSVCCQVAAWYLGQWFTHGSNMAGQLCLEVTHSSAEPRFGISLATQLIQSWAPLCVLTPTATLLRASTER